MKPVSAFNVANTLTSLRLALVPLFLWLFLRLDAQDSLSRWAALAAFCIAMITDFVDGHLARAMQQVTDWGKIADPIADKFLVGAALISLSYVGEAPWWITITILVREIGITLIRLVVVKKVVLPAGRGGKSKTTVQTIALILLISPLLGFWHVLGMIALWLALILTVVTGLDYLRTMRQAVLEAS